MTLASLIGSRILSLSTQSCNAETKDDKLKLHYRIVVLGSAQVGKTSIIRRFLHNKFDVIHAPTVEELYQNEFKLKGPNSVSALLTLDILDTSGSFTFPAMRKLAIETGDAFVLVFSIDDDGSFDEMCRIRELIARARPDNLPPIVVVSNKSDLYEKRVVRRELAETLATIDWEAGYVECSAKTSDNVDLVFGELFRQKQTELALGVISLPKRRRFSVFDRYKWRVAKRTGKFLFKPNGCPIA